MSTSKRMKPAKRDSIPEQKVAEKEEAHFNRIHK